VITDQRNAQPADAQAMLRDLERQAA
jgi:hypothetical protein